MSRTSQVGFRAVRTVAGAAQNGREPAENQSTGAEAPTRLVERDVDQTHGSPADRMSGAGTRQAAAWRHAARRRRDRDPAGTCTGHAARLENDGRGITVSIGTHPAPLENVRSAAFGWHTSGIIGETRCKVDAA